MTLFPEFDAEVQEIAETPPSRPDLFLVVGVWEDSWNIPSALRGPWFTRDAAEKAAEGLSKGWRHLRIVRIPGEES